METTTTSLGRTALLACLPVALWACVYDSEPPRRLVPEPAPPDTTPAPAPVPPMLVVIDTDQTMTAAPGEGVGVFVEYASGGRWHIFWTCDTAKTQQACDFSVSVSVASGSITNLDSSQLANGYAASTPSRFDTRVVTTNELHGVTFDTDPGAVITLDAAVSGLRDGSFLFFVQDGRVNGGYQNHVTNPLQLQGNRP